MRTTARKENRNIIGAVNGDMLGYPIGGDTMRIVVGSYLSRNRLVDSAVVYNQRYGIGLKLVEVIDSTGASDYGPFSLAGYDALDVAEGTADEIWGGADPFYHTVNDSAGKLHFGLVRRAAQLMLAVGAELAGVVGPATPVEEGPQPVPEQYALMQNFPNPFNPSTTIRYSVPQNAHVTLSIFNTLGQQVSLLQQGEQEKGYHEVRFDGKGLSSGVYYYRMVAVDHSGRPGESFVETRKLILVKCMSRDLYQRRDSNPHLV